MLVHEKGSNALVSKAGSSIRNMSHKMENKSGSSGPRKQSNSEPELSGILTSQNLTSIGSWI